MKDSNNFIYMNTAITINNFNRDILFIPKNKKGLYVGIKEDYKNLGVYDNSRKTLKKITKNEKLFSLLSGEFSHISMAGILLKNDFNFSDIFEFFIICKKLNIKIYDTISEKDNKIMYEVVLKQIKNKIKLRG